MRTVGLLFLSNIFMTFAWYAHLKNLGSRHWLVAVLVSYGIAFFEYLEGSSPVHAREAKSVSNSF